MKQSREYETFSSTMDKVLKADPAIVKAAMEAEKRERAEEAKIQGKRGRGRPPKNAASGPASS